MVVGPTGVGKTALSIEIAEYFGTAVISADSRQIYREMRIGTAVPSPEELERVPHYFIGKLSVKEYYNSWEYERDALAVAERIFRNRPYAVLCGGSMMYVDAVCRGMDEAPDISPGLREEVCREYADYGLEHMLAILKELDPVFYAEVDRNNPKRVLHAVEICRAAGRPCSDLRKKEKKKRDFEMLRIGLDMPRQELYDSIDKRVDDMIARGLEEEARRLYPFRAFNALNTVGYKEWFDYFEGKIEKEEVVRLIKRNSRRYAKKQLTWFRKDKDITWFHPDMREEIFSYLRCPKTWNLYGAGD